MTWDANDPMAEGGAYSNVSDQQCFDLVYFAKRCEGCHLEPSDGEGYPSEEYD